MIEIEAEGEMAILKNVSCVNVDAGAKLIARLSTGWCGN